MSRSGNATHPLNSVDAIRVSIGDIHMGISNNARYGDQCPVALFIFEEDPAGVAEPTLQNEMSKGLPINETDPRVLLPSAFPAGHSDGIHHPEYNDEWRFPDIQDAKERFVNQYRIEESRAERWELTESERELWRSWFGTTISVWQGHIECALSDVGSVTIDSEAGYTLSLPLQIDK